MSFFRRVFGSKADPPRRALHEMTIPELFAFLREGGERARPATEMIAAFRRLTDLALFEHGVPSAERDAALDVAAAIHSDIQASMAEDPEALAAFEEAADFHLNQARLHGYGSLHWLMEEQQVESAQVIDFIATPEHAERLPAYLEMIEPEVISEIRAALLAAMARLRAADGETAVATLARLALENDGAITMLLSGPELSAISRGAAEVDGGLAVLRAIGVQP